LHRYISIEKLSAIVSKGINHMDSH